MSADDQEATAIATVPPSHAAEKRDLLGHFCFYLHFAVVIYFLVGWGVPLHAALIFYLCFVPAMALQWQFNKDACILNNLESVIRTGRWRNPHNREEGAWLQTLVHNATGIVLTASQVNLLTHALLVLLWLAGLSHLLWW